jgi:hypothetical protein
MNLSDNPCLPNSLVTQQIHLKYSGNCFSYFFFDLILEDLRYFHNYEERNNLDFRMNQLEFIHLLGKSLNHGYLGLKIGIFCHDPAFLINN